MVFSVHGLGMGIGNLKFTWNCIHMICYNESWGHIMLILLLYIYNNILSLYPQCICILDFFFFNDFAYPHICVLSCPWMCNTRSQVSELEQFNSLPLLPIFPGPGKWSNLTLMLSPWYEKRPLLTWLSNFLILNKVH